VSLLTADRRDRVAHRVAESHTALQALSPSLEDRADLARRRSPHLPRSSSPSDPTHSLDPTSRSLAPPMSSPTTTMNDPAQAQSDPAPPDDPDHPFAAQLPPPLPDYPVPPALPHLAEPPSNSLLFDLEATAPITHRPPKDDPRVSLRAPLPPPPPYCPLSSRTTVDHDPEPATLTEFRDNEGPAKRLSRLRSLFDSLPAPSPPSSPAAASSALPAEQTQPPQPAQPAEPSTHEQRCAQDRRNYTRELWRKCGASVAASVAPVAVPPGSSTAPQVGSPALERQRQAALAAVRWKAFEQYADDKERELWRAFVDLDRDGDMRLRAGEVREACRRAGIEVKEQAIDDFVRAVDRNGDGFISFDEWRDFLLLLPRPISMKEVWRYWQARPLARPSMSRLTQDGDGAFPLSLPLSRRLPRARVEDALADSLPPPSPLLSQSRSRRRSRQDGLEPPAQQVDLVLGRLVLLVVGQDRLDPAPRRLDQPAQGRPAQRRAVLLGRVRQAPRAAPSRAQQKAAHERRGARARVGHLDLARVRGERRRRDRVGRRECEHERQGRRRQRGYGWRQVGGTGRRGTFTGAQNGCTGARGGARARRRRRRGGAWTDGRHVRGRGQVPSRRRHGRSRSVPRSPLFLPSPPSSPTDADAPSTSSCAVSRTATAPFDRLKVYLITSATGPPCPNLTAAAAKAGKKPPRPGAGSLTKAIRTVYNQGGGIKAFWTGNGLNIIKIFPVRSFSLGPCLSSSCARLTRPPTLT